MDGKCRHTGRHYPHRLVTSVCLPAFEISLFRSLRRAVHYVKLLCVICDYGVLYWQITSTLAVQTHAIELGYIVKTYTDNAHFFFKLLLSYMDSVERQLSHTRAHCHILRLKCAKFDFGWGSAPDPAGGAHSAPPGPLAGFKGSYF